MNVSCTYGFGKVVEDGFDRTVSRVREALRENGFGILSQIDLKDELPPPVDLGFRRYIIITACNAAAAGRACQADANFGLLLPSTLIVYEEPEGRTTVMSLDPARFMDLLRPPAAIEAAMEVREKLEQVLDLI